MSVRTPNNLIIVGETAIEILYFANLKRVQRS